MLSLIFFFSSLGLLFWVLGYWRKNSLDFSAVESPSVAGAYEAARMVLDSFQLFDINVREGAVTRYVPAEKAVSVSKEDFGSRSIAALGRALHEAGHARQHMKGSGLIIAAGMIDKFFAGIGWAGMVLTALSFLEPFRFLRFPGMTFWMLYLGTGFVTYSLELAASRQVYQKILELKIFSTEESRLLQKMLDAQSLERFTRMFDFLVSKKSHAQEFKRVY